MRWAALPCLMLLGCSSPGTPKTKSHFFSSVDLVREALAHACIAAPMIIHDRDPTSPPDADAIVLADCVTRDRPRGAALMIRMSGAGRTGLDARVCDLHVHGYLSRPFDLRVLTSVFDVDVRDQIDKMLAQIPLDKAATADVEIDGIEIRISQLDGYLGPELDASISGCERVDPESVMSADSFPTRGWLYETRHGVSVGEPLQFGHEDATPAAPGR